MINNHCMPSHKQNVCTFPNKAQRISQKNKLEEWKSRGGGWWGMLNSRHDMTFVLLFTRFLMCVWVSGCEYVLVIAGTHRGFGFPGAGVTDGCEPPNMGSENQTRVFCKSSRLSWLLSQLSRPTAAVTACVKSARDWARQHFVIEGVRSPGASTVHDDLSLAVDGGKENVFFGGVVPGRCACSCK